MDPVQIPTNLAELDLEALRKLFTEARTYFVNATKAEDVTSEDAETLRGYAQMLTGLRDEIKTREEAAKDLDVELQNMAKMFEEDDEPEADEPEEPAEEDEPEADEPDVEAEPAKEPVLAAAKPLIRRAPRPQAPAPVDTTPKVSIRASAETSFAAGTILAGIEQLAVAMAERSRGVESSEGNFSVATIEIPMEFTIGKTETDKNIADMIQRVGDESRLPGGSLVAAAGWCKPSELLLDFCPNGTADGLFDLPEIGIEGGGVRYVNPIDYSALYAPNAPGFHFTEAELIAGATKTCVTLSCPTTTEIRLEADGYCVEVPIPLRSAWPELVEHFLREVMVAYQYKQSRWVLNKVLTATGAALLMPNMGSVAGGVLMAVELVIETQRQQRKWGKTETVEAVAPSWLRGAMRADYAMRTGVDLQNVTDQTIQSYFAARHARVQFVYDWQVLPDNTLGYPEAVDILVYRAGTFVKGVHPVINLGLTRDSVLLKQNIEMAAFFEQGQLLLQRCGGAKLIRVPVCVGGITGAANNTACGTAA